MNLNPTSCISSCGLCSAGEGHLIESQDRHGQPLRVVICNNCGVVRNDPIPSPSELTAFYSTDYRESYKNTREPKRRHAARYFPIVARHIEEHWRFYEPSQHVLDIGSGSGEFLYLMRSMGKNCRGLEPTSDYAQFCRNRLGLDVTTGEIGDFAPQVEYDHIRLCHVVEHLRDPVSDLRKISSWLRPEGMIYVEVPDFETYCRTKTPGRMFHYGHIYNFDHDTFARMVEMAGLEILHRIGPTAAFLRKANPAPSHPSHPAWSLQEKLAMYGHHRSGQLKQSRGTKLAAKFVKIAKEHWMIFQRPDHHKIAQHVAAKLKMSLAGVQKIPHHARLERDWLAGG